MRATVTNTCNHHFFLKAECIKTAKCLKCEVGEIFLGWARTHSFTLSPHIYFQTGGLNGKWSGSPRRICALSTYLARQTREGHPSYPCSSSSSFLNSFCLVYRLITKRRVLRKITYGSGGQKMRVFSPCVCERVYILGMTLLNKKRRLRRSHIQVPLPEPYIRGQSTYSDRETRIYAHIYLCDGHI